MAPNKNPLNRESDPLLSRVAEMSDGAGGSEAEQPPDTTNGTKKPSDDMWKFMGAVANVFSKRGSNR